jgi:hypothetical protein
MFNALKQVARTCLIIYEKHPTETKTVNTKRNKNYGKEGRLSTLYQHYKKEVTLTLHTYINVHWPKVYSYSEGHVIPQFYGTRKFITRCITVCYGTLDPYPELAECSPHPQTLDLEDKCPLIYANVSQVVFFLQVF